MCAAPHEPGATPFYDSAVIWIRSSLRRRRGSITLLCLVGLICFSIASAHGGPASEHMSSEHQGGDAASIASVCLAVLQIGGAVAFVLVAALVTRRSRRSRFAAAARPAQPEASFAVRHRARAGPAVLQVFLR